MTSHKTNHLQSHSPEHTSHRADKMFPLEYAHTRALTEGAKQTLAKLHTKRSRRYSKQLIKEVMS